MNKSEYCPDERRTFTIDLYPNNTQIQSIQATLDACDILWNKYLKEVVYPALSDHETNISDLFDENAIRREITRLKRTEEYAFLNDADRTAINAHMHRLYKAFEHHKRFPQAYGAPKERDLHANFRSYTTMMTSLNRDNRTSSIEIDQFTHRIKLPKLGYVQYRGGAIPYPDFDIMYVTIQVKPTGIKAILNLRVLKFKIHPIIINPTSIGIDPGIRNFLTLSTGEVIEYPGFYKEKLDLLSEIESDMMRALVEHGKDSKEYKETSLKSARIQEDIAMRRRNFHYRVVHYLLSQYNIIYMERLLVTKMIRGTNINNIKRAWYDPGFFRFFEILVEQARKGKYNSAVYFVPETYQSSKICHVCGHIYEEFDIKGIGTTLRWVCPFCNTVHDRDVNAAINIRYNGRFMVLAERIAAYQDMEGIPREKYPVMNNGNPNLLNLKIGLTYK